jgi:putative phosphoribosyl transferase
MGRPGEQLQPGPVLPGSILRQEAVIHGDGVVLPGMLATPADAVGVVAFAHGTGSSRFSRRNMDVANQLNTARLATLLFDLLTPEEELERRNVFDVSLLADRLLAATSWLEVEPTLCHLPIGYFGASTGAAAALWAAAEDRGASAIVSRGGRPDLAASRLAEVRAPTLLIVGGRDEAMLELNENALQRLTCVAELSVVKGATHLFEETGALDQAAMLARDWFLLHLDGRITEN